MALVPKSEVSEQPLDDLTVALDDVKDREKLEYEDFEYNEVIGYLQERFQRSEGSRLSHEQRWLSAYRNYRGVYGPDVAFSEAERSRVFIKITKSKVQGAYSQLVDVLCAGNKFPIGIDPTKLPEGVAEAVHIDPKEPEDKEDEAPQDTGTEDPYGYDGDGRNLPPGATLHDLLGPLKEKLKDLPVKEGPGETPTAITFEPALVAAKKMEKKIQDQLDESDADKHLRYAAFEMTLFGTGILKGPLSTNKEYPDYDEKGKYVPHVKLMPKIEAVSIWEFYPDPDASNMAECEYTFQRHKYNRSQLRALKKRPYFRKEAIEKTIDDGPNWERKWWETDLLDNAETSSAERWEVLEFWGVLDTDIAERSGLDIPKELEDMDQVQVNIWICGNTILRLVMNPFTPARLPYFACPYELNPYSIFGIGVAENMEDTQSIMNGSFRMAVDNGVLSGNLVFEIDDSNLVPGQDLKIYPGKVFRRQGGAPGQAIFGTKFPNVTQENMMLFDKARQLADEATGIPSFSHGQTGVSGVGRTAAGISMLMGAAANNIKTVVKNLDDYMLRPLGESLFHWNSQFDPSPDTKGDLEVTARGTESLLKNEVRSQRLLQFLQVVSNPQLAAFAKLPYLVREIARGLDLDPEKVANSMDEAARQALVLQQMQGPQGQPGAPGAGQQQPTPPGSNPSDPTGAGGGTAGVGMAPTPGEPGFAANTGGGAGAGPMPGMGGPQ